MTLLSTTVDAPEVPLFVKLLATTISTTTPVDALTWIDEPAPVVSAPMRLLVPPVAVTAPWFDKGAAIMELTSAIAPPDAFDTVPLVAASQPFVRSISPLFVNPDATLSNADDSTAMVEVALVVSAPADSFAAALRTHESRSLTPLFGLKGV
jgi:hypothetical protein